VADGDDNFEEWLASVDVCHDLEDALGDEYPGSLRADQGVCAPG